MALATAKAMEAGAHTLLCASTGNTSASAAAYAARYGLRAFVLLPAGGVAKGKLAEAMAYGARIVAGRGAFHDALKLVRARADVEGPTRARDASDRSLERATDAAILPAQRRLRAAEGLLAEPASAAPLPLLSRMVDQGLIAHHERILCIVTGNGLKDPTTLTR